MVHFKDIMTETSSFHYIGSRYISDINTTLKTLKRYIHIKYGGQKVVYIVHLV